MKILLFGKNGQVGWELHRSLASLGEVIAIASNNPDLCGDLSNFSGISHTIKTIKPALIVNAAAYTAVDKAEGEKEKAQLINTEAVGMLADEAKKYDAWLVHYSTDYVFDGSRAVPWKETDEPNPLNVYGVTKLEGEKAIQVSGCKHLIFRTSWVYASRGNNFIKTIIKLAKERDVLKVINDQVGAPTGAELIADVTARVIETALRNPEVRGLYHLAAGGETSWYGYADFILNLARQNGVEIKVDPKAIIPIPSHNFPTAAIRPHNSRLDTSKLKQTFGLSLPDWHFGVVRALHEILQTQ